MVPLNFADPRYLMTKGGLMVSNKSLPISKWNNHTKTKLFTIDRGLFSQTEKDYITECYPEFSDNHS